MGFCDGTKTTNTKCAYFDKEEFRCTKQGYRPPKKLFLKENGKNCKQRKLSRNKKHRDKILEKKNRDSYIPNGETGLLIQDLLAGLNDSDVQEFKTFLTLNEKEKVIVFKVAVLNEHPIDFAQELYGNLANPKQKIKTILAKPDIQRAIEELSKPSKNIIKSSILNISIRGLEALEEGIKHLNYQQIQNNGGMTMDNLKHIIEMNEKISNIYAKYNKVDDRADQGIILTFGDNTTLKEIMEDRKELSIKKIKTN